MAFGVNVQPNDLLNSAETLNRWYDTQFSGRFGIEREKGMETRLGARLVREGPGWTTGAEKDALQFATLQQYNKGIMGPPGA